MGNFRASVFETNNVHYNHRFFIQTPTLQHTRLIFQATHGYQFPKEKPTEIKNRTHTIETNKRRATYR